MKKNKKFISIITTLGLISVSIPIIFATVSCSFMDSLIKNNIVVNNSSLKTKLDNIIGHGSNKTQEQLTNDLNSEKSVIAKIIGVNENSISFSMIEGGDLDKIIITVEGVSNISFDSDSDNIKVENNKIIYTGKLFEKNKDENTERKVDGNRLKNALDNSIGGFKSKTLDDVKKSLNSNKNTFAEILQENEANISFELKDQTLNDYIKISIISSSNIVIYPVQKDIIVSKNTITYTGDFFKQDESNSGDDNQNNKPSNEKYIKGIDYMLDPNTPEGKENDKSYWITNPFTRNTKLIEEWGNVPLPMKNNITKDDLNEYFYRSVLNNYYIIFSFGKRKIDTETMINAYIEWLTKNWNLFPYLSFQSPPISFDSDNSINIDLLKENSSDLRSFFKNNTWNIKSSKLFNNIERVTFPSIERTAFEDVFKLLLSSYIMPGMSDIDKVYAIFTFVLTLLQYQTTAPSNDGYAPWVQKQANCMQYAYMSSQLLNFVGIPSVAIDSARIDGGTPVPTRGAHAVTWVYIDGDGSGKKKWYMLDTTFSDLGDQTEMNLSSKNGAWQFFMQPIQDNESGNNFSYNAQQNNYFMFYEGVWATPFLNNEIKISNNLDYMKRYGTYNLVKEIASGNITTKPSFYNGSWYNIISNSKDVKYYKSSMNSDNVEDITSKIPKNILEKLKTGLRYSNIGGTQYGSWEIFVNATLADFTLDEPSHYNRYLIFHDLKNDKWIDVPLEKNEIIGKDKSGNDIKANYWNIQTMYIKNDKLNLVYTNNVESITKEYDLPKEVSIKTNDNVGEAEFEIAKQYYRYLGNTHKIGDGNYEVSLEEKKKFNEHFDKLLYNRELKGFENIINVKKEYDKFETSISQKKDILFSQFTPNDKYTVSKDNFKKYGLSLDVNGGFSSFSNLSTNETDWVWKYDIYFSKNGEPKESFKKIASNLDNTKLSYDMFKEYSYDPTGHYYIVMHTVDKTKEYVTKKFTVETTDDYIPYVSNNDFKLLMSDYESGPFIDLYGSSNYSYFEPRWFEKSLKLKIEFLNGNYLKYNTSLKLNYYNFNTKQLETTTIDDGSILNTGQKINKDIFLNKINGNNKGVYFLELDSSLKSNPSVVYKQYSRLIYLVEKSDIESNNFKQWVDLSTQIMETINKNINLNKIK